MTQQLFNTAAAVIAAAVLAAIALAIGFAAAPTAVRAGPATTSSQVETLARLVEERAY
ncbi:hypothetical protein ACFORG_12005 [Lutimaribacter marinistellae]|uniref:Uncharacterized protein n=1 Tax=Lutimaribacter marinistellae TaxID=1820329 RepID=A0ABV7TFX6_9RHOB